MTAITSNSASASRVKTKLAQTVGKGCFDRWFASAELGISETQLDVTVPSRFVADFIDHHYHDQMLHAAEAELGEGASVNVSVTTAAENPAARQRRTHNDKTTPQPAPQPGTRSKAKQLKPVLQPHTNPNITPARPAQSAEPLSHCLADFVVGPCNDLAYRAAARLAEEPDYNLNPLFIHAPCGQGKTHLLHGICKRFTEVNPTGKWAYLTAERFTNQFIASIHNNRRETLRRQLRRLDLLAIDDVHFLAGKSATQNELLHTIEALRLSGAKIVLASNLHPKQLTELTPALTSRFLSGIVTSLDEPDPDTWRSIIQALARKRGLILAEGVTERLADHNINSVREAVGLINKLAALASLRNNHLPHANPHTAPRIVGHAIVNDLLGIDHTADPRRPVRLEQIVHTVCDELNVARSELMSKSRHRRIVLARSLAVHLARLLTNMSFPELARALDRPNHSTVVTAAQRIKRQIEKREPLPPNTIDHPARIDELAEQLRRRLTGAHGEEHPSAA